MKKYVFTGSSTSEESWLHFVQPATIRGVFIIILIILFGLSLRIYRLDSYLYFSGDEGRDLLIIKDILTKHTIPLQGPPTSLGWFHLGPLAYYIYAPVLWLGGFHPAAIAVFNSIFDTIAILFVFLTGEEIVDRRTGLIAGMLYASSPYTIILARMALHIGLFGFFATLFFYFLFLHLRRRKIKFLYACFFLLGIGVQIHLTAIFLCLPLIFFTIQKKKKNLFLAILLIIIPLIPFWLYEVQNGLIQTQKLVVWIPYRILSFFGLVAPKNMISSEKIHAMVETVGFVLQRMIFLPNRYVAVVLFLIAGLYTVYRFQQIKYLRMALFFILVFFAALFLHSQPAWHYFGLITPLLFLLLGYLFRQRRIGLLIVFIIISANVYSLIGNSYFVSLPFAEQADIMDKLLKQVKGQNYKIQPPADIVDLPDYYKNYSYIGWWRGNSPLENNAFYTFTIYQRKDNIKPLEGAEKMLVFPNAVVVYSKN